MYNGEMNSNSMYQASSSFMNAMSQAANMIEMGNVGEAIALCKHAINIEPNHPWGWELLAEIYDHNNKPSAAEETYKKIISVCVGRDQRGPRARAIMRLRQLKNKEICENDIKTPNIKHALADGVDILDLAFPGKWKEVNPSNNNAGTGALFVTAIGIVFINEKTAKPTVVLPYSDINNVAIKGNWLINTKKLVISATKTAHVFTLHKNRAANLKVIIESKKGATSGQVTPELIAHCVKVGQMLD